LAVTKKYTHVTSRLARDAADRIAQALWPVLSASDGEYGCAAEGRRLHPTVDRDRHHGGGVRHRGRRCPLHNGLSR
jgi:hypothetical protein